MNTEDQFGSLPGPYEQMGAGSPGGMHGPNSLGGHGGSSDHLNHAEDPDADSPLFATDEFRVWCMKVIPCTKRFVHDWTVCPFAHAGEKAVRRDPRTHSYTGIACPDMKKMGSCIRGDRCPYAHNVFEYWLHPTRYRTQLCNDGPVCRRGICFFAHSLEELRVPACKPYVSPEALARASLEAIQANPHPLSAQLPLSAAGTQPHTGMPASGAQVPISAQQQAVLAALAGPSRVGQQHPHMQQYGGPHALPSPFTVGPPPSMHTHTNPEPPRLSVDYGSLPRWSDNLSGYYPGQQQHNLPNSGNSGNAGRFSFGAHSDYASACSTPARLSAEVVRGSHNQLTRVAESEDGSGNAGRASNASSMSGGSPRAARRSTPSPAPVSSKGSGDVNDDELAHSLATLKIALTQQNAAATTASNHEVVINTLHQILREAVAQQGTDGSVDAGSSDGAPSGRASEEEASAAAAAAYAALAASVASFGGTLSGGSATQSISDISADTPGRMSLEAGSPTAAGGVHAGQGASGAAATAGDGSGYRLSQDLVRALN